MKSSIKITAAVILMAVAFVSCDSNPSLQQYYVENTEKADFISLDLPISSLGVETTSFTAKEKEAYESVRKLNVLAFKLNEGNKMAYEVEKDRVKAILSNPKYNELMTMGAGNKKATVKYLGDENAIDEVIVYGKDDERGFALVRVLGNDMKPENMMGLIKAMEKADFQGEEFKQLENFFRQ